MIFTVPTVLIVGAGFYWLGYCIGYRHGRVDERRLGRMMRGEE